MLPHLLRDMQEPCSEPCILAFCHPSDLAGRHIAQAQLMQSCLGAVKTSMLVIQRTQETISIALQAEQSGCKLEETLSGLLDCYIHILADGKKQDRNVQTSGNIWLAVSRHDYCVKAFIPLVQSEITYSIFVF